MSFSERAKLTALAIVHIFETSKPFGEFDAYVVLDDGAGVSYGLSQFTHRSGSLLAVIEHYLKSGGKVSAEKFQDILPTLRSKTSTAINRLALDKEFKNALKKAAKTSEMQSAQIHIAQSKYFSKAEAACNGSNFVLPLSLAVVYDSINHGSWEKIRDRVKVSDKNEKAWITEYVRHRDAWLESVPRLRKTDYRTDFFLAQIGRENWQLNTPMNVHGFLLQAKHIQPVKVETSKETDFSTAKIEDVATSEDTPSVILPTSVENSADLETKKEESADNNLETVKQYIPKITQARNWLGGLTVTGFFGTILAKLADAPQWFIFVLGVLTGMALMGLLWLFLNYYKQVFALVRDVIKINADPEQNNIQLTAEKQ